MILKRHEVHSLVLRFNHLLWSISQGFLKDYERPDIAVPTSRVIQIDV